jgi:hypothetical protein
MLPVRSVISPVRSCSCARLAFVGLIALLFMGTSTGATGCSLNPQPLPPHTEPGSAFDEADAGTAEKVDDAGGDAVNDASSDASEDRDDATDASGDI